MAHHTDARQRAFEAKQGAVLDTIRSHGHLASGALAQRELLDTQMATNAVRRQLGPTPTGPGPVRRWLGARVVALGTRLAGAQAGLQAGATRVDEPAATHGSA